MEKPHSPASTSSPNDQAAASFVRGEPTGDTADLSVAGEVLLAGGRIAVALRGGTGTVFVRADLPAELADLRTTVERALSAEGLASLDTDSSLAAPLARERLGVESARWDLWGRDLADVFAVLSARGGAQASVSASDAGPAGDALPAGDAVPLTQSATSVRLTKAGRARRRRPRSLLIASVVGLALLSVALFVVLGQRDGGGPAAGPNPGTSPSSGASPDSGASPNPSGGATAETAFVDYRDPDGRFTLQYPETWQPVESTSPDIALLLVGPDGGSMLVRVLPPLPQPIDPTNIADVKAVTDVVVRGPSVQILQEEPINLSGVQGYYYLYTFQDEQQEGVHSHFFLFQGTTVHTLVFQALPSESFSALASTFDRIALSYKLTT